MIKIYTDGSCINNPGNGGWAAIINDEGNIKKILKVPTQEKINSKKKSSIEKSILREIQK